jgi:Tol biopolymer transport system component
VSPAGNNVAVVSDGNDGDNAGVELHVINSKSKRMRKVSAPSQTQGIIRLGHNDPDFNSNGTKIAFTFNDNAGTDGEPRIGIFACRTKANCTAGKTKLLRKGFANPSWSPDDKLLAVETTDGTGRDIAIIAAKSGIERVRLTTNGDSFAPEFSPDGRHVAYLHRDGTGIDVRVITLDIDQGKITLVQDKAVTSDGEVDGESGVSWSMPRGQRAGGESASEEAAASAAPDDATDEVDEAADGAPPPPPGS